MCFVERMAAQEEFGKAIQSQAGVVVGFECFIADGTDVRDLSWPFRDAAGLFEEIGEAFGYIWVRVGVEA